MEMGVDKDIEWVAGRYANESCGQRPITIMHRHGFPKHLEEDYHVSTWHHGWCSVATITQSCESHTHVSV